MSDRALSRKAQKELDLVVRHKDDPTSFAAGRISERPSRRSLYDELDQAGFVSQWSRMNNGDGITYKIEESACQQVRLAADERRERRRSVACSVIIAAVGAIVGAIAGHVLL